jgi:hypothetical protein
MCDLRNSTINRLDEIPQKKAFPTLNGSSFYFDYLSKPATAWRAKPNIISASESGWFFTKSLFGNKKENRARINTDFGRLARIF